MNTRAPTHAHTCRAHNVPAPVLLVLSVCWWLLLFRSHSLQPMHSSCYSFYFIFLSHSFLGSVWVFVSFRFVSFLFLFCVYGCCVHELPLYAEGKRVAGAVVVVSPCRCVCCSHSDRQYEFVYLVCCWLSHCECVARHSEYTFIPTPYGFTYSASEEKLANCLPAAVAAAAATRLLLACLLRAEGPSYALSLSPETRNCFCV